jgi:hypothetical protein
LNLLDTYPELAKHLKKGEKGQLIISDEGWKEIINEQFKAT